MIYKYWQTVEVEKERTIVPSQVYTWATAKKDIKELLNRFKIVDFRVPRKGEHFIVAEEESETRVKVDMYLECSPRFIVVPLESKNDFPEWE